jgi:hypothetical protein
MAEDGGHDVSFEIQLIGGGKHGPAPSGPKPLFGKASEGKHEIFEQRIANVEEMDIEMKGLARAERTPIQVRRPEDEGARPVREPAGALAAGGAWFKHERVRTTRTTQAEAGAWTRGLAYEVSKESAEGTAQDVSRFVMWKVQGPRSLEVKAQPVELERQHCKPGNLRSARNTTV